MGKSELKKIAQDWCKSILLANDMASFDEGVLTREEQEYIVNECHRIANRITDRIPMFDLKKIISKHHSNDSHSPDPVPDTLQEGDWFQGTEEQYRRVLDLGTKEELKPEIPMYIVSALHRGFIAFVQPSTLSWQSCDRQTQLTPEEFIRRAENTFKNQK